MTLEQLINNLNGGVTCRTCKYRVAYTYNGYNDLYDQANVDASHPLYRKFTDPAKDKYYFPYNGKAVPQETTVSDLAKILGWDESVWDFSGALPELK